MKMYPPSEHCRPGATTDEATTGEAAPGEAVGRLVLEHAAEQVRRDDGGVADETACRYLSAARLLVRASP